MTTAQFTAQGAPAYPITINSNHVASVRPLRKVTPTLNTQTTGQVTTTYSGSEILLANGLKHNVLEGYEEIVATLFTETMSYPTTELDQIPDASFNDQGLLDAEGTYSREDLDRVLNASTPDDFVANLKAAGVPVTQLSTTSEPYEGTDEHHPVVDFDQKFEAGVYTEQGHAPAGGEPPAGTPLTEEELASVAKHDSAPETTSNPPTATAAEKRAATLAAKKAEAERAAQGPDA